MREHMFFPPTLAMNAKEETSDEKKMSERFIIQ